MTTLYIIRHGQSVANTGAKSMPDKTIALTELGQEQAEGLLKRWQAQIASGKSPTPSHIYHSQMLRAKQTSQVFSRHFAVDVSELDLLNEFGCLGFKTVEGMMGTERGILAKEYWQNADINHRDDTDADTFSEFITRVDNFIKLAPSLQDNSLCFGHGIWIGLLAYRLLDCKITNNLEMQKFRQFQQAMPMYNTVVYCLDISDDGVMQLRVVNTLQKEQVI